MKRICKICGDEFTPNASNQQYCSEPCRKQAVRKAKIEREKAYDKQIKKRKYKKVSLDETVREIDAYNKEHGTRLTYGDWQTKKYFGEV